MITKSDKTQTVPTENLFGHCWERLSAAVSNRDDPWRTPALATAGADGPGVRTVVLRGADQGRQLLDFHTDRRAAKVLQLNDRPDTAWMFYNALTREQLRCRGPVTIHSGDAIALEAWGQLHRASRSTYAQDLNPGAAWDTGGQDDGQQQHSSVQERAGFANFMLVRCTVRHMDWLQLGAQQNIRILMRPGPQGWLSKRVAP